jgi:uncharacterized membrane protein (DUF2068 family)
MPSQGGDGPRAGTQPWLALVLCAAVLAAGALEPFFRNQSDPAPNFAPNWIPLAAAVLAAAGIVRSTIRARWLGLQPALRWSGLLLMLWAANGLPFDVLRLARAIPLPVNWPGLVTKTLALAAVIALARVALARPDAPAASRPASWYGYAAFLLALPYPVLRTHWAMGGMLGLLRPGGAGEGWAPWILAIPWFAAAALSLLLVPTWRWMPRRLLLVAGWTATAITGMIGPAAVWVLVSAMIWGAPRTPPGPRGPVGIAFWIFALFYGSWFLFAIAAGAATRSYQLRSAAQAEVPREVSVAATA